MLEVELLNEQTVEAIDEEIVDNVEEIVEQSVVETVDGLIPGEEIILQQQEVIFCFWNKTSQKAAQPNWQGFSRYPGTA